MTLGHEVKSRKRIISTGRGEGARTPYTLFRAEGVGVDVGVGRLEAKGDR